MITVILQGGLGNQLFQYAYGRALMKEGKDVVFDISFFETNTKYTKREYLLDKFLISDTIKTVKVYPKQKLLTRIRNKLDVTRKIRYVPVDLSKDDYIADGYYVTPKYFSKIREIILQEVVLREKSDTYKDWEQKILNAKNPLMLHARRTDNVGSSVFANVGESYFKEALAHFDEDCELFCFSDNIPWLMSILSRPYTMISGQGCTDYEELMLMSLCKNFIIPNSTYSWWGSWLSRVQDKKIIAPKKWYTPSAWERANEDIESVGWVRI